MAGIQHTNELYKNSTLTFHVDKITSDMCSEELMMDWENSIMEEHANVVCHNAGDVLEIGFGMGISADYIQALNPTSHTIIEIHPQINANLVAWAVGKPNVNVIHADWFDVKDTLGMYDGIFYDAVLDMNINYFMQTFVPAHIKSGGKFTYFNAYQTRDEFGINPTFTSYNVTPTVNSYYNYSTYQLPIKQF